MSTDIEPVKRRAQGAWPAILAGLGVEAAYLRNRHGPCPACGGKDRFRFDDRNGLGTFYCNHCGAGDGFALLERVNRWTFRDALQAVARWLGMEASGPARRPTGHQERLASAFTAPVDPVETCRRRLQLQRIWDEALPADHPQAAPLRRYLWRRGLRLESYPRSLRWHPGLTYFEAEGKPQGRYPTLLARVLDTAGRPVTLHRTYLTRAGEKAPVPAPKKLMAHPGDRSLRGGAIRLFPVESVLSVAEGIETALAVHQATALPVWSLVSAGLLAAFQPPAGVQTVLIWADLDRAGAGQDAAAALAERLQRMGLTVRVLLPPEPISPDAKGVDWLDVLVRQGPAAVRLAWQ